jgi:predicted nucleic-acid-binding protein
MGDPALLQRFRAWLQPAPSAEDDERALFFRDGLIVLDTNVLLSLYEYTATSREAVLDALEQASEHLWMPYQVGLEFVRGRRSVLESRKRTLSTAAKDVNSKIMAARRAIIEAKNLVRAQLEKYARAPEEIAELEELVSDAALEERLAPYRDAFMQHLSMLKTGHDLVSVDTTDPILPRIAELYGDRVGHQPDEALLRRRLDDALTFRFPNKIPPGFLDADKDTPLGTVGDFLLWEEMIEYITLMPEENRRVLFISNDTKGDWYEKSSGMYRPWPALSEEMQRRAGADLRVETPVHFYSGIREFLNADLADDAYAEIERVSESFDPSLPEQKILIDADRAAKSNPPKGLAGVAYRSAGLSSSSVRSAMESPAPVYRLIQWWLIGATAQLRRREITEGEPNVDIVAAVRGAEAPAPHWKPGTVLPSGEWLHRESSWIAPWFLDFLKSAPAEDRPVLSALAAEQADENQQVRS